MALVSDGPYEGDDKSDVVGVSPASSHDHGFAERVRAKNGNEIGRS